VSLTATEELRLVDIPLRETVELVRIDLPVEQMEPLLERGVLPGCQLCPVRRSPSGDPIVMVEGTMLAIRREVASCLCVRRSNA
jgi:Fe2+ transport system protein FeoA